MSYSIYVKRKDPVPGNTFTADWTSTREQRRIGNWVPDTCSNRPSSVAEFDIELNMDEYTALVNGNVSITNDMLRERLHIELVRDYDIVSMSNS